MGTVSRIAAVPLLTPPQRNRPPPARHGRRALLLHIQGPVHVMSRNTPQLRLHQPLRAE